MLIRVKRGWEMSEREATPEAVYRDRRRLLQGMVATPLILGMGSVLSACDDNVAEAGDAVLVAAADPKPDPSAGLYPVTHNLRYKLDRPVTDEELATTYNNFYEFGSSKNIHRAAQQLPIRPWMVRFDGLVEQPFEMGVDELLAKMPLEERLYRHRCVEAWSMAVPWSGFGLRQLVEFAKPLSGAKYLKMTTLHDPDVMRGQRASWYPWPYVDGLTIEEATNELAFIATGLYGKPIPRQNGAPLRLVTPWKYGFKCIKSVVAFEFTDKRPVGFWEELQGSEYGFWANVNPEVAHPRWSQATEQVLGSDERVPTQLYNGYGEFVADLYADKQNERLFM